MFPHFTPSKKLTQVCAFKTNIVRNPWVMRIMDVRIVDSGKRTWNRASPAPRSLPPTHCAIETHADLPKALEIKVKMKCLKLRERPHGCLLWHHKACPRWSIFQVVRQNHLFPGSLKRTGHPHLPGNRVLRPQLLLHYMLWSAHSWFADITPFFLF